MTKQKASETNTAARTTAVAELPFKLVGRQGGFLVALPVFINNLGPFYFGLDTGDAHTSIARSLAEQLALPVGSAGASFGFGGGVSLSASRLNVLRIGQAIVEDLGVAIAEFGPFLQRLGAPIDGMLGHDVLGRFVVHIDYPRSILRLSRE